MLLTKKVCVKVNGIMIKYYRDKGYDVRHGDEIIINISELPLKSRKKIEFECDYCGKISFVSYADYTKRTGKDSCSKCSFSKAADTLEKKYGVRNHMQLEETKEKIRRTNLERYGCESPLQNENVMNKLKETVKNKYGVKNVMHVKKYKDKLIDTCKERYGCDWNFANEKIKNKIFSTNIKKYGFKNVMKNPEIAKRSHKNGILAMSKNGTQVCSKQQYHIYELFGGKLNHLYGELFLDIFFAKNNIYLEYNGSGHDIDVKYKKITESEFKIKEIKRYKLLKRLGLKQIIISSKNDVLPSDETLLSIKEFAFYILNNTSTAYIIFDIYNNLIKYSGNSISFDFFNPEKSLEEIKTTVL